MHINFDPDQPAAAEISFDQFLQVDIRVGEIVHAEEFPEARNPSYRLVIDFGSTIGQKKSAAQITHHYSPSDLIGRRVLAVVNFPSRQIGPMQSEVLVLGVADESQQTILIKPDSGVPKGARLH